jgi:hypothetical protein
LIQGTDTPRIDYRAALKANPSYESPSQAYRHAHPSGASRDAVMEALASAQKSFLENSRSEASQKFAKLVELLPSDDWSALERGIFVQALMRLAQLETDPVKQREYLARSLSIAAVPEAGLYPPPLLKQRTQLEQEIPKVEVPRQWFEDGWTVVLINGQACRADNCEPIAASNGSIRVTLLSEQWIPVTAEVRAADLAGFKAKRVAWYEGTCGSEKFNPAASSLGERRTLCDQPPGRALNLNPVASSRPDDVPRFKIKEKADPFYKNPWFWGGVGAVVVAVAIASSQNKDGKEPTTTYGFK